MQKLVKDLYKILDHVNSVDIPVGLRLPESFSEFLSDMKNSQYDAKTFALRLKVMVCHPLTFYILISYMSCQKKNYGSLEIFYLLDKLKISHVTVVLTCQEHLERF